MAVTSYVRTLANNDVKILITVAVFSSDYQIVRRDVVPSSFIPITNSDANPVGGTALNDAIGEIVAQAKSDSPEHAVIIIVTDGGEGDSKLKTSQAAALLTQCRLRGWQVKFIGIDCDSAKLAGTYGATTNDFISATAAELPALMTKIAKRRAQGLAITFSGAGASRKLLR
jgi:hypothetical protein